jgi:hypothetical protein
LVYSDLKKGTSGMNKRTLLTSLSLLALLCACGGAGDSASVPEAQPAGATYVDIGDHVVHFSAQSTDQLPAAVAKQYDIVRSADVVMLNISVIQKTDNASVEAIVSTNTTNRAQQVKGMDIRPPIVEPGEVTAIYYIGDTSIRRPETLIFDVSVTPDGVDVPSVFRFVKEFPSN